MLVDEMRALAEEDQTELVDWMYRQRDPVCIAQALEALADSSSLSPYAVPAALDMLHNDRPFVREAAVMALSRALDSDIEVVRAIKAAAQNDSSHGVRETAREALVAWIDS